MRIHKLDTRLNHTKDSSQYYFDNEYKYYKEFNRYPFVVDDKEHISLYKRLNIQLLVTKRCPFNCSFCIEKENPIGGSDEQESLQFNNLNKILLSMEVAGLTPTVSITGGEPMLKPEFVNKTTQLLDNLNVPYNINTSGYIGSEEARVVLCKAKRTNLSVHSFNAVENSVIFGRKPERYWLDSVFNKSTIQKVFTTNEECHLPFVKHFIHNFNQDRFSFRFPTEDLNIDTLEWKYLFKELENDKDCSFIQQKIGDYYWYEDWLINEKHVHISFSSLKQLVRNQNQESDFVRAVIVEPNGTIKYDWI